MVMVAGRIGAVLGSRESELMAVQCKVLVLSAVPWGTVRNFAVRSVSLALALSLPTDRPVTLCSIESKLHLTKLAAIASSKPIN